MSGTLAFIIDILEVFITMLFYINMNKCKYRLPCVILIWANLSIALFLATNSLRELSIIRGPILLTANFIMSLFLFSGKWYKKLFVVFTHIALIFVGELLAMQLYILLYGSPQKELLSVERILCSIFYINYFSILASVVVIINKRIKGKQLFLSLVMQLTVSLSLLSLIFLCFWRNSSAILEKQLFFLLCVSIPLIIINLFMFSIISSFSKIAIREKELEYIEEKNKNEYAYYKLALENEKKISEMRHDMANYMQVAMKLSKDGLSDGKALLDEFNSSYPKPLKYCENEIVNMVLALKQTEMERLGVKSDIEILSALSMTPYNDMELVSILSNLLDNAIRGASTYDGEKIVKTTIVIKQNHLIISVENPSNENVMLDNAKSTKKDDTKHGLGLGIIKKTVAAHGGTFTIEKKNDTVTALIITENKN